MAELLPFALASSLVLASPGFAVLGWINSRNRPPTEFRLIYALALGLAINPLIFLLFNLFSVPVTVPTLLFAYAGLWVGPMRRWPGAIWQIRIPAPLRTTAGLWTCLFALVAVAIFFLRWSTIRGQTVLPGVDANAHALIGSLFLENRGIPDNYLPYTPINSFSYHFGVHSNSAALATISGLPLHRVQFFLEPLLIALTALGTTVLAHRVTASRNYALAAGVLVGFVAPFPAWYLNWARLPQLAALVLLPLVLSEYLRVDLSKVPQAPPKPDYAVNGSLSRHEVVRPILWILTAGLTLTHYRIAIVLAYALFALIVQRTLMAERGSRELVAVSEIKKAFVLMAPAGLLVAPWIARVISSFQFTNIGARTDSALPPLFYYSMDRISYIWSFPTTGPFITICIVGLVILLKDLRPGLLFLFHWSVLLVAFSNPYVLPLPVAGLVDAVTVVSVLYIPLAIVGAGLPAILLVHADRFSDRPPTVVKSRRTGANGSSPYGLRLATFHGLILIVAVGGAISTQNILWQAALYVKNPDIAAFDWIKSNVEPSAVFFSPTVVSPSNIVQPTDAGAWISYFTGHRQATPLSLYRVERTKADYEMNLIGLINTSSSLGTASAHSELKAQGVTHLFLGSLSQHLLRFPLPDGMLRAIYDEDGVRVYEVLD